VRILAGVVTAVAAASAVLVPTAAQAAAPYTAFTMNGAAGSSTLDNGGLTLSPTTISLSALGAGVSMTGSTSTDAWAARVTPPTGAEFAVGTRYEAASQADAGRAGLHVGRGESGCGLRIGWVVIKEFIRNADTGVITSFAASYGFTCGPALAPNTGELRFNSAVGYTAATVDPGQVNFGIVEMSAHAQQRTVTVSAVGSEPMSYADARLMGTHANADYTVLSDGCVGRTIDPGQTCSVTIEAHPTSTDGRVAFLVIPTVDGTGSTVRFYMRGHVDATGTYRSAGSVRIMDTRTGTGVRKGAIGRQGIVSLQVTGHSNVPANGVAAVVLNVTVTGPTYDSYLTVYPHDRPRPTASNLNYSPGWTGANLVTVSIDAGGMVDFYNHSGSVHVIADVVGYYESEDAHDSGFGLELVPTTPQRILDTRRDGAGKLPGGSVISVPVNYGQDWNPHIRALAVNITAVDPDGYGYLTAWDGPRFLPPTSTLNFSPGSAVPNLAFVQTNRCPEVEWCSGLPVINVYNGSNAGAHVLVDVVGLFQSTHSGLIFKPLEPTRIADSRSGLGIPSALGPGVTSTITTPSTVVGPDTAALSLNVTAVAPTADTFVTVWPGGAAGVGRPAVSNLNPSAGRTVPNAAITGIGPSGGFNVYNNTGSTHILVDVAGTFEIAWGVDALPTPVLGPAPPPRRSQL
jgi:hypothetical protein